MDFIKIEDKNYQYRNIICEVLRNYGFDALSIFPKDTFISGSTVLNLIKSKEIKSNSDLDLYIQKDLGAKELSDFIDTLDRAGYTKKISLCKYVNELNNNDHSYKMKSELYEGHKYFSLKEHIHKIITVKNINNKSLDIIFINNSIEDLISNTFDFNIVKNYIRLNKTRSITIYSNNLQAINNNIATITLQHFNKRILHNAYEFNNFVKRYVKYSKDYDIYIGDKKLTNNSFHLIILYIIDKIKEKCSQELNIEIDLNYRCKLDEEIIYKIKIDDTVYSMKSFNDKGLKQIFKHVIELFNNESTRLELETNIHSILSKDNYDLKKLCTIL